MAILQSVSRYLNEFRTLAYAAGMAIDWHPIDELPEAFRDGREVLLWTDSGADVGTWKLDRTWTQDDGWVTHGGYWEALYESARINDATHFAEIDPPVPGARRLGRDYDLWAENDDGTFTKQNLP